MHNVNWSNAPWDFSAARKTDSGFNVTGASGVSFKEMLAERSGIRDLLDRLSERFPNAQVTQGRPEAGVEGAGKYFGNAGGDHLAVDEKVLTDMASDGDLAKKIEEAVSAFFNSSAGASPLQGAYAQRSVSLTVTAVRLNVSQYSEDDGSLLTGQELETTLQEKMRELIDRFFTADSADAPADVSSGSEDAVSESNASKPWAGYGSMMFSMELFFSSGLIGGMGNSDPAGQSTQFSGSFFRFSSSFLPQTLHGAIAEDGGLSGPFTSLLEGALGGFGLSSNGYGATSGGFSLKMGQSRDLLSLLLDRLSAAGSSTVGTESENGTAAAAGAEGAAEALAAMATEGVRVKSHGSFAA